MKNPLRLSELQSAHIFMAGERFKLQFVVALTQQATVLFTPCSEFLYLQLHRFTHQHRRIEVMHFASAAEAEAVPWFFTAASL